MSIPNNPLDWKMYRYSGMEVTAANFPEFDRLTAEEYLDNWASRHKDDCQVMGRYPLRVKISLTPREIKIENEHYRHRREKMRRKAEQCECGYKTTDHEKMIRHKDKYCKYRVGK